jgi:IS605 OrfB family transposase
LGIDINAWGVSAAWCTADGNKPTKGESFFKDYPIDWVDKSSNQVLHEVRHAAQVFVDEAAHLGCPIGLENLDFDALKTRIRYDEPSRARQLSGFAYQKLIEAILARAAKIGVEVRFVNPAWTSLVGWAKYGSRLGMNPDQAAAFCIARRAVLSKGSDIRRAKRGQEWIDQSNRPEKLQGLGCNAGRASAFPAEPESNEELLNQELLSTEAVLESQSIKNLKTNENVHDQKETRPEALVTPKKRGPQQSMRSSKDSAERQLGRALGKDRKAWPRKLAPFGSPGTLKACGTLRPERGRQAGSVGRQAARSTTFTFQKSASAGSNRKG